MTFDFRFKVILKRLLRPLSDKLLLAPFRVIRITGGAASWRLHSFIRLKAVAALIFLMINALDGHRFLVFLILVAFAFIVFRLVVELRTDLINRLNLATLLLESRKSQN